MVARRRHQSEAASFVCCSLIRESCKAHCFTVLLVLLQELVNTGKAEKLKGFELIKAVHLEPAMFSIEEDLLTPTFKLKRPQLQKKYQKVIDALYATVKE